MKKLPWIISTGACALSGFVVATASHKNVAEEISTKNPGKIQVEFVQPAPELGKVASLAFAAATGFSLWMTLKQDSSDESFEVQPSAKRKVATASTVTVNAPSQDYDVDEEFDVENLESVEPKDEALAKPQSSGDDKFFRKMFYHLRRHTLVPCATGSGKTTMLLGAILWAFQHFGNDGVEFFISTTKAGNFLGLENMKAGDQQPYVLFVDPEDPDTILPLYNRLRFLRKRLIARGKKRMQAELENREIKPVRNVICLDEWNETLDVAKAYDTIFNRSVEKGEEKSYIHDEMVRLLNSFIRTGREDEVCVWVFGQDHQVQNAQINTGYQKSIGVLVPFRKDGGMESIEDVFVGQRPIAAKGMGKDLLAQAQKLVENSNSTFAYSSLEGHEFLEMPYLPDVKRQKLHGAKAKTNVVAFPKQELPKAVGSDEPDPWGDDD